MEKLGNTTIWNLFISDLSTNTVIINHNMNYSYQSIHAEWATEDHNNTNSPQLLPVPVFYNSSIKFSNGTMEGVLFNTT